MTNLDVPFAHTIEPSCLDILMDEVGYEEWDKKDNLMHVLARYPHKDGGGASFYVLFLDPAHKTLDYIIGADALYALYDTEFYNEEIHLITPKQ